MTSDEDLEKRCIDEDNLHPPSILLKALSPRQQQAAAHVAQGGKQGIVWWKVGEGKTRIALAWMYYVVPEPRPLIICSPGAFRQWDDEIEKLRLDDLRVRYLSFGMLSRKDRALWLDFAKFNCVVIDELWMYKNYKAKRSSMIRDIVVRMPTIGLSGSMVTARNIEDIYGQARAVCLDKVIARNVTDFRTRYCLAVQNWAGFIDRFPRHDAVKNIQTKLAKHIDVYFPKETREIRNIDIHVDSSAAQKKIRYDLVKEYYYDHQEKGTFKLEIKSALSLLVKLQQISDGFLRDGEGHTLRIPSNKCSRLKEICAELLDAGERVLIWVAFRKTATILRELLPYPVLLLSGEQPFDSKSWHNRRADICVATVGSGASLNDFADVRYAIFYSTRFSHVQLQQAKGRTIRASSNSACRYYYHMMTNGFPDQDIFQMINSSRQTEETVIAATNKVLASTLSNEIHDPHFVHRKKSSSTNNRA